jgi:nucleoside-diphosphate-sugar epimerase
MPGPNKIAVIGGGGFIGGELVKLLLADGCRVRVVSRSARPSGVPNLECVRGDVADEASMRSALEGVEVVYHLAMGGGDTWADFQRDFVDATAAIARICRESGVRRLIYTSSSAALYLGGRGPVMEADGPDPQPEVRSLYSRGKVEAERLLMRLHREEGLPVTILRPCIVVGRGGIIAHGGAGYWASDTWCLGWGNGRNPLPFVLVQDVAAGLRAAKDAPGIEGMAFTLAGDVRPSAVEYIGEISRRTLRRFHFRPRNLRWIQAIEIGKWALKALARKPGNDWPSYRDFASRGMLAHIDCSAAKQILGWKPNADPEFFYSETIESNVAPIHPEDLRLASVR